MLPSQIQYKDLLNNSLAGCLFCACGFFFTLEFCPNVNRVLYVNWTHLDGTVLGLSILPLAFATSYAVGTAMGSSLIILQQIASNADTEKKTDGWRFLFNFEKFIGKIFLRINRFDKNFNPAKDPRFIPFFPEECIGLNSLIREEILKHCHHNINDIVAKVAITKKTSELHKIFKFCISFVQTSANLITLNEVNRQSVMAHFCSQLSTFFSLCVIGSLLGLANSIWHWFPVLFSVEWSWWLILFLYSWFFASKCGNKALRYWREYCSAIYLAFYHCSLAQTQIKIKD